MMSIGDICLIDKALTSLSNEGYSKIINLANQLQIIADLNKAHVFIDCESHNCDEVIVIAEAIPKNTKRLYQKSVIGQCVYEKFEPAVFEVLKGKDFSQYRAVTQEGKVVEQSVTPILLDETIIGTLIMEKDISSKVMKEKQLKSLTQAASTLSNVVSSSKDNEIFVPDMIEESLFDLDKDLNIRYFNLTGEKIVREINGTICETGLNILKLFPAIEDMLTDGRVITIEEKVIQNYHFQIKCIQLFEEGVMTGHLILMKDITDLKQKERELITKSAAISEIHHRVKNNLQTVASILRLQMRRGLPEGSEIYFQESLNRIMSIASVYEVILDESSTDLVNIEKLIKKIGNMIVYNESSEKVININYESEGQIHLLSNIAVSLALIANELITNSLKHAFKNQTQGTINVNLRYDLLNQSHILEVQDTGMTDSEFVHSFGLKIVKTISENDLEGTFDINRNSIGTIARVQFQYKGDG